MSQAYYAHTLQLLAEELDRRAEDADRRRMVELADALTLAALACRQHAEMLWRNGHQTAKETSS